MKRIIVGALVGAAVCCVMMSCGKSNNSEDKYAHLRSRLDSLISANYRDDAPGVEVLVAVNGEVAYERYIGIADMATGAKIDSLTRMNIASCSKQMTAVSALRLQEAGLLNLEDSVAKYFPEFKGDMWKKVRLKHLLSHSSGVLDLRPRTDREFTLHATDEQSLEYMVTLDTLHFEPGTQYEYINPTFQVFYALIQKLTGESFVTYQQKNIFDPCGMANCCYFDAATEMPNMAHGYVVNEDAVVGGVDSDTAKSRERVDQDYTDGAGVHWAEFDYGEETFFATKADGGVYCTVRDLLKWENALAQNKLITAESLQQAYTKHTKVSGSQLCQYQNRPNTWYGFGWFIDDTPCRELKIYHTGDNGGFQAYVGKYPASRVNVIMLENRNDLDRWQMQLAIERILIEEGFVKGE